MFEAERVAKRGVVRVHVPGVADQDLLPLAAIMVVAAESPQATDIVTLLPDAADR